MRRATLVRTSLRTRHCHARNSRRCFRFPCAAGERRRRAAAASGGDAGRPSRRRRGDRGPALASRRARRPQQRRLGLSRRHRREGRRACARGVCRPRRRRGQSPPGPGARRPRLLRRRHPRMLRGIGPALRPRPRQRAGRPDGGDSARLVPWRGALHRRRARHGRVLRRRGPGPGRRSAGLPQPLADAARPAEALRHSFLRRRGAGGADRRARRRRAARAALDRARRGARAQRLAQVADADAEDPRDARPLCRCRRADGAGRRHRARSRS